MRLLHRRVGDDLLEGVHSLCIADVRGAEAAAQELGPAALGVTMDVTDEAQVESGIAQCVKAFGGIDILVSNAGVQHIAALVDLKLPLLIVDEAHRLKNARTAAIARS